MFQCVCFDVSVSLRILCIKFVNKKKYTHTRVLHSRTSKPAYRFSRADKILPICPRSPVLVVGTKPLQITFFDFLINMTHSNVLHIHIKWLKCKHF